MKALFSILLLSGTLFCVTKPRYDLASTTGLAGAISGLPGNFYSIMANPAGLGDFQKSYDIFFDGQIGTGRAFTAGVADSWLSPVSGAVTYSMFNGGKKTNAHQVSISLAYRIFEELSIGINGRYQRGDIFYSTVRTNGFFSLGTGILFVAPSFSLGVYSLDLFAIKNRGYPPSLNWGGSWFRDDLYLLADMGYSWHRDVFERELSFALSSMTIIHSFHILQAGYSYRRLIEQDYGASAISLGYGMESDIGSMFFSLSWRPKPKDIRGSFMLNLSPVKASRVRKDSDD